MKWKGEFEVQLEGAGRGVVFNEILESGIEQALRLWAGESGIHFDTIALLNAQQETIATRTRPPEVDTVSDPSRLKWSVSFGADEVTEDVAYIEARAGVGIPVARAPVPIDWNEGQSGLVRRRDFLSADTED